MKMKKQINQEKLQQIETSMLTSKGQTIYIIVYLLLILLMGYWFAKSEGIFWKICALILAIIFSFLATAAYSLKKEIEEKEQESKIIKL